MAQFIRPSQEMKKLIGIPDPEVQAKWMREDGYSSCAEAEANGAMVTWHPESRAAIDAVLRRDLELKEHLFLELQEARLK